MSQQHEQLSCLIKQDSVTACDSRMLYTESTSGSASPPRRTSRKLGQIGSQAASPRFSRPDTPRTARRQVAPWGSRAVSPRLSPRPSGSTSPRTPRRSPATSPRKPARSGRITSPRKLRCPHAHKFGRRLSVERRVGRSRAHSHESAHSRMSHEYSEYEMEILDLGRKLTNEGFVSEVLEKVFYKGHMLMWCTVPPQLKELYNTTDIKCMDIWLRRRGLDIDDYKVGQKLTMWISSVSTKGKFGDNPIVRGIPACPKGNCPPKTAHHEEQWLSNFMDEMQHLGEDMDSPPVSPVHSQHSHTSEECEDIISFLHSCEG